MIFESLVLITTEAISPSSNKCAFLSAPSHPKLGSVPYNPKLNYNPKSIISQNVKAHWLYCSKQNKQ